MIGLLVGRVASDEATGNLVLDVGGVGYELLCPVGTVARAAHSEDGRVTLHVHTNLRQDALELFGFHSHEERSTFRRLVSVPGVGPRLALSVLNVLPTAELSAAIEAENAALLSKVPGVGKKTAERLILELKGKLVPLGPARPLATAAEPRAPMRQRLEAALTGLGYRPAEAERAAKALTQEQTDEDLSALLRKALGYLAS